MADFCTGAARLICLCCFRRTLASVLDLDLDSVHPDQSICNWGEAVEPRADAPELFHVIEEQNWALVKIKVGEFAIQPDGDDRAVGAHLVPIRTLGSTRPHRFIDRGIDMPSPCIIPVGIIGRGGASSSSTVYF